MKVRTIQWYIDIKKKVKDGTLYKQVLWKT